jgi:hypothetical protein
MTNGMAPMMNAKEIIRIGRSRGPAAPTVAVELRP